MQNNSLDKQDLIIEFMRDFIKEKRSDRRWKNFRFLLGFFVIIAIGLLVFSQAGTPPMLSDEYVSLVRLNGMIGPGEDFSAETILPILKEAFGDKKAKGVILNINSGGGTPVQASIMYDAIIELKNKYHKKVIVVGEDIMASGAYYVAAAADKIYVNPNTITGSIGVIMKEFGFPELIKKVGIERRVYTAGANKDRLDPFLPQSQEDINKIRQVINEVHENFEHAVEAGRKGKLHGDPNELFSGDFWSGQTALKLGLVDGLGNLSSVMRDEFHVSEYKDYSQQPSILKNVIGHVGTSLNMMLNHDRISVLEKI